MCKCVINGPLSAIKYFTSQKNIDKLNPIQKCNDYYSSILRKTLSIKKNKIHNNLK